MLKANKDPSQDLNPGPGLGLVPNGTGVPTAQTGAPWKGVEYKPNPNPNHNHTRRIKAGTNLLTIRDK